ncbi:MAG: phosphoenolpyruvate carboxylase, partial [Proteobacteria bacterium]|nr:phosphoenolpyruvate carboxylase [Pseudomonadota bacterium]
MNENIANKFDKDLQFVMICLQEVLQELHHDELLACIPWLPHQQSPSLSKVQSPFRLVQLLSISFQLLGMIEENINVQERREQQADGRLEREYGLWPWALETLQKEGYSEATLLQTIQGLQVEPVLTAHPTESKRATVLEHHRDLYLQLVKLENQMWTPVERQWLKDDIKASLERLWRTGEIYRQRPDLKLELRNTLHYLRNIFPALLPWLDHRFETAWQQAGSLLPLNFMQDHYPRFSLGNWVGGDRDGHPLVSAEITQSALLDLRLNALIVLRHQLTELSKKLSLSDQVQKAPEILCDRLAACAQLFPSAYQTALQKHDGESWRVLICIMIERLPIEVVRDHATQLDDRAYCYKNPQELMQDFAVLHEGLLSISAHRLVQTELKNAVRTLQCLGFHSAVLDIRQNSQFHDEALSQLLVFAGVEGAHDYPNWTPLEKSALIHKELELLR